MPIYEYQCGACGHRMEAFQNISEEPLKSCPECQKDELQKLVSAAGFQLKGGGWYVTDYASKKKSSSDSGTSTSKDKTDSSSSSGAKE